VPPTRTERKLKIAVIVMAAAISGIFVGLLLVRFLM
jgi:hypothetical protein